MRNWLNKIFNRSQSSRHQGIKTAQARHRLSFDVLPSLIYAIGDVHGCLDLLLELEAKIADDCAKNESPALIIMLGDYVDRGSNSSAVIDHLLEQPTFNATRICLLGNHEETMLAFINSPKDHTDWLDFGGRETLVSYGISADEISKSLAKKRNFLHKINSYIPQEHIDFLKEIPIVASYPNHVFVHAGIRPNVQLVEQSDEDLIWIRKDFLEYEEKHNWLIIHGHTPVEEPFSSSTRIDVDTGAYTSGKLSAVKIFNQNVEGFLTT